jgi:DNA-binding response OmpR family regulator
MDLDLPDVQGIDVTRQIKSVERYSSVPIIMITGHNEKRLVLECRAAGAEDFVVKPFERDVLLSKVRRALQRARSRDHSRED